MKTLARAEDKVEVLHRLEGLTAESPRRWGRMNAPQMVCHLSDSFLAVTGQKDVSMAASLLYRTLLKWIALYLPVPWPPGISTRPELDQVLGGGTKPAQFAEDVARLRVLVEQATSATPGWHQHPRFGRMSETEWLRWAYLHMDHHLRQFGV